MEESKPHVKELRRSSKEILQAVDKDSSSSETVQSRLSGVKQRQRRLLAKVHKKQSDMERDMNVFKTFHDHLKSLETWLADVDTAELDQPISIEPDGVREQIHKTETLRDEVYEQLSLLEKAQKLGEKIISTCEDEKAVKDEVNGKLGKLDQEFKDLMKKVNDRQKELKQALLERQEFREAFDDMKDWLVSTKEILEMQGAISVKYDVLVDQKAKHRPIGDDIAQHTSSFDHVMKKGEELLETRAPGKEKKVLRKRLDDLQKRWDDVTSQSSTRETQIEKVLGLVEDYNNVNKEFVSWLSEGEKKVETAHKLIHDQDAVEKQQELLEELHDSVEHHKPDHEKLNQVSEELLKVGRELNMNEDIQVLEKEMDSTNQRWIDLQRDISEKLHTADQVERDMADFQECVDTLRNGVLEIVDSAKDIAVFDVPAGDEIEVKDINVVPRIPKSGEISDNINTLKKALNKMEEQSSTLDKMNELGEALAEKTSAPEVKSQMINANEDHESLSKRLNDAKQTLDEVAAHWDKFKSKSAEVDKKLPKLKEKVEALEPTSARPNTVKKQLQESENISKEVYEVVEALESVQEEQDWLFDNTEVEPEVKNEMKETVERVKKPLNEVHEEVKKRQNELQAVLVLSREFEAISGELVSWLTAVEEEQAKEKTVSAVYDTVKKQQQDHKTRLEDIKKHKPLYLKIVEHAKEIIEDTEQSPEQESLVKEVSFIENRWQTVVANAETRDHELARVLPEAKRCQTKVQSLEPKLAELEKKLESSPDMSVDTDGLEKQTKDAEQLRKEVDDLATLNDEMTDSCNTLVKNPLADLTVVAAEVENLKARYGAILDRVSVWQAKVNNVDEKVSQYNKMKKPIEETVVKAEQSIPTHDTPVSDAEIAKSELDAVEKSIEELDALRPEKTNVAKIGSEILKEVGEESPKVAVFKEGFDSLDKRFTDAREKAVMRKIFLESQLKRLEIYEVNITEVEIWIKNTLVILDKLEPVSTKPEKLAEQLKEANTLQDEAVEKKQVLETALEAGQWLADNTNDVEQRNNIVGRMTKTRANFDRVAKRVDDRFDRLQIAELKSKDVEVVFDEFNEQLRKLEEEFESQSPVSAVRSTLDEQKRNTDTIDENLSQVEPVFEKLVDLVQSLLDTSEPSEDREVLEHKLDDVKIRWYCLREKVPEREEQILLVLPLARKFENITEPFTPWLDETERRVGELESISLDKDDVTRKSEEVKALREDVTAHEPELKNVENVVESLVKTASADEFIVEARMKDLSKRYDSLQKDLSERVRNLDTVHAALREYENSLEVVERIRDEAVELAEGKVLLASPVEEFLEELREVKVS